LELVTSLSRNLKIFSLLPLFFLQSIK